VKLRNVHETFWSLLIKNPINIVFFFSRFLVLLSQTAESAGGNELH